MKALALALALTACGPFKRDNEDREPTPTPPPELVEQGNLYCAESSAAWEGGIGLFGSCDAAGFAALHSLRCDGVDLSVFEDEGGRPHRSANHTQCWDYSLSRGENAARSGASKAGFSRDHVLFRMVAAWRHKDLAWVDRFVAYLKANDFAFCDAIDDAHFVGRCKMSPTLYALLLDMQKVLSGAVALAQNSDDRAPEDFEGHLRMWYVWLSGEVRGGINDFNKSDLKALAERESENALYQAAWGRYRDGDVQRVYTLLADTKHWPTDRLPADTEHCTDYLFQRDMLKDGAANPDWLPCSRGRVHTGTDFNAALYIAGDE